ncbi:MAG: NAD(P)H-hydrate dehydratase [Phycisphaerae bacterium]|nr:NAD(P)H-hydrate dehydratase [Phycisphaerae bacterium]
MRQITEIPKLSPRPVEGHKGAFGRVCIIAGSVGMGGAAALAGSAALRAGSGLVRIATATSVLPIVAGLNPCYTTLPLAEDKTGKISAKALDAILDLLEGNDVIACGPGMGQSGDLKKIVETLIAENIRLILDGDGLNNLAGIKDAPDKIKARLILTPHPGEFGRLWNAFFRISMSDCRADKAAALAAKLNCTVILKGHQTIVSDSEKNYVNTTGNPGMATAGSGDVLTGVITALAGQGLDNFDAAVLGVYIHGLAGDLAAEKLGQISLTATDIIEFLPQAFINSNR